MNNGMTVYYMKCESEIERYHWIFSLLTSATGKPKTQLPSQIPPSMREKEAFKRKKEREREERERKKEKEGGGTKNTDTKNSDTKNTDAPKSDYHSKRRQKYAERNEKRAIRKEAKRNRKIDGRRTDALARNKAPETWDDYDSQDSPSENRRTSSELHRSQKVHLGDMTNCDEVAKRTGLIPDNNTVNERGRRGGAESGIKVNVVMHGNNNARREKPRDALKNDSDNLGYDMSDRDEDDDDDEDLNGFTRIEVLSCKANVLPNVASSDSDDCDSTDNTSMTSPSSMISGPDFRHDMESPRDLLSEGYYSNSIGPRSPGGKRQQQQRPLSATDGTFVKRPSPRPSSGPNRAPLKSVEQPQSHRRSPSPSLLKISSDSNGSSISVLSPRRDGNGDGTLQTPRSVNTIITPVPSPKLGRADLHELDLPGTMNEISTSPKPITKFSRFMDS